MDSSLNEVVYTFGWADSEKTIAGSYLCSVSAVASTAAKREWKRPTKALQVERRSSHCKITPQT